MYLPSYRATGATFTLPSLPYLPYHIQRITEVWYQITESSVEGLSKTFDYLIPVITFYHAFSSHSPFTLHNCRRAQ